ncbi:hypothetical protein IV203_001933 [Nitzschia inconspicua]|uniref:Uncharacterized protein n=1 Tax=Nitzschia inconspicua TaxID=303405 RepID=A0A9K3L7N2_9STRA|nr:hypothetical protein IV203_001933 [Nitzschia inconspicua]
MIRRMTIFGKERMHNLKQSVQKRVCPALCENLKSLASLWKCPIWPECQEFASFMKRAEDNRLSDHARTVDVDDYGGGKKPPAVNVIGGLRYLLGDGSYKGQHGCPSNLLADRVQAKLSKLWDLVAEADRAEEEEEGAKAEEAKDLEGNQQVNEDEEDEEDVNDLLDLSYQGN